MWWGSRQLSSSLVIMEIFSDGVRRRVDAGRHEVQQSRTGRFVHRQGFGLRLRAGTTEEKCSSVLKRVDVL